MKRIATISLLFLLATTNLLHSQFRRGTGTIPSPESEFYLIDSDDDSPLKPTYGFADTSYGTWVHIVNFDNLDDGYSYAITSTQPVTQYYNTQWTLLADSMTVTDPNNTANHTWIPGGTISTNGTIDLHGFFDSPNNVVLPNAQLSDDIVAPLWTDWEMQTGGSSVYVRATTDSFCVNYYNMALKGTSGNIRATFQVVFGIRDSTITFNYKSFSGTWNGVSAASLIQRISTIGMMDAAQGTRYGITYLHNGTYLATSPSSIYRTNLHNGLSIKFLRRPLEAFAITGIANPPYDHYELSTNVFAPQATIRNQSDTAIMLHIHTTLTNLTTGSTYYSRYDSTLAARNATFTYTGPSYSGVPCGPSKLTMSITYRDGSSDQWPGNNSASRILHLMSSQSAPFRDEFNSQPSGCAWINNGTDLVDANTAMYVPDAGITNGAKALVFNRLDASGNPYLGATGGDTLTTAAIDLSGSSTNYLYFHYQRGTRSDTSEAGIFNRIKSGPETQIADGTTGYQQLGDTLFVEAIPSSASAVNPSTWTVLGAIPGGFDTKTQTFRALIPALYAHSHSRFRLRLKALMHANYQNWFEDADNFVVDQFHVEPFQANKTELEPIDIDFGNGIYNRVPRDLTQGLTPKVRIMNNGDGVSLGLNVLHVVIHDALNRAVYDKAVAFSFPQPRADSLIPMPAWDIHGSEGGVFNARVSLEQTFYEIDHSNDTNVFFKTMYIGDSYGIDDSQPDTVGSTTSPATDFTYIFTPLGNDTLRGAEFYYSGVSPTATWGLTITSGNSTTFRSLSFAPSTPGFYRSTFLPVALTMGVPDTLHFVMNTGNHLAGDAQYGLARQNISGTGYDVLHPEILSHFFYGNMGAPYTTPSVADQLQGGALLPMMRLVTSGSQTFLPVEVLSMNAMRLMNGTVAIAWKTANEEKVVGYDVTRVADVQAVGSVVAAPGARDRSYLVTDVLAPTGEVTYEIAERDQDGTRHALGRVSASAVADEPLKTSISPNPGGSEMRLIANKTISSLTVFDPGGRTIEFVTGGSEAIRIPTEHLASGVYYIEVHAGSEVSHSAISVIH